MNKKIIWGIILIIIVILGVYFFANKKVVAPVNENQTATSTQTIADWKVFTNTTYGYSFKYPSEVGIVCNGDGCDETKSDWIVGSVVSKGQYINIKEVKFGPFNDAQLLAQEIWERNRIYQPNFPNKQTSKISTTTISNKLAYQFVTMDAYNDDNGSFVLDEKTTFTFVRDHEHNFVIWFPTDNEVSRQIVSTFKFTSK